jgi:hypothetical protein
MADQRITDLTPLSEASVASIDVLPIVDISASETKKVTAKDLFEAGAALADNASIDLIKLNQSSATKIGTTALADGAITAPKLANNSSIVYDSVEPASNNFTGRAFANSTDKNLKIYDGAAYQQIVLPSAGIATNAITTAKITDGNITTVKLADNAITTAKILDSNVTTAKIADNAITSGKFQAGAVDAAAIATNAVGSDELANNAVDTASIIDLAVTAAKLADNAVTESKLNTAAVTNTKIANTTIEYSKLNLADNIIPGAKIVSDSITVNQLASSSVSTSKLTDDAVTTAKIATNAITTAKITDGNITTVKLADNAITTAKITDNNVTYAKIQQVTATDKLLGRSSAGAGIIEEIPLTAAGRALLDDADASAQRTTLGLGSLATQSGIFSGTHSGTTSGTNTGDQTITLTGDITGSGSGSFATTIANNAITTAKITDNNVTTAKINAAAITGAKLAASSSTVVSGNAPTGSGEFTGQQWINTNTGLAYVWTGAQWLQQAGVQSFVFTDSTPLTFSSTINAAGVATITSGLDVQNAATIFSGPTTGSAATPTFRTLVSTDLPIATASVNGAIQPGTGLSVTGAGVLNHINTTTAGIYTKVTVDAQGHISTGTTLNANDIPNLDASKITTGTFNSAFLAANSVTATQLADYGIAQVSESAPTPEFAGQWWINPSDRSAYIWVGTVSPAPNGYWLLVGYGTPTQLNLRFGGTYNATTNLVVSLNQFGTEAGLTVGQALSAPNPQNNGVYLIVTTAGNGTSPAPVTALANGDWVLSQGTGATFTKVGVVSGAAGTFSDHQVLCDGTFFNPDMIGVADVRAALNLLWGRAQIATTAQYGVVLESTEVLVDNSTGAMSIGVVDDGSY